MSEAYSISDGVAGRLADTQKLLIGGQWTGASDSRTTDVYNPSSGQIITRAAAATEGDTTAAISAARVSFDGGAWTGLTPAARGRVLWKIGDLLEEHADEIAELEMLDAGKFYRGAREGEVPFAAECFRYYAGWCTQDRGQHQGTLYRS